MLQIFAILEKLQRSFTSTVCPSTHLIFFKFFSFPGVNWFLPFALVCLIFSLRVYTKRECCPYLIFVIQSEADITLIVIHQEQPRINSKHGSVMGINVCSSYSVIIGEYVLELRQHYTCTTC